MKPDQMSPWNDDFWRFPKPVRMAHPMNAKDRQFTISHLFVAIMSFLVGLLTGLALN